MKKDNLSQRRGRCIPRYNEAEQLKEKQFKFTMQRSRHRCRHKSTVHNAKPKPYLVNGVSLRQSFHRLSHLANYLECTGVDVLPIRSAWEASMNKTKWRKDSLNSPFFQLWRRLYYPACKRVTAIPVLGRILLSSIQKKFSFSQREAIIKKESGYI